jgi:hypothetical protein
LQIYALVPTAFEFEFDVTPVSVEDGVQTLDTRFSVGTRKEVRLTRRCLGIVRTSQEIVFHPVVSEFNNFVGRAVMRREGGCWRDMLVSMPPLREVTLRVAKSRSVIRVLRVGEGEDGVRLGMLFDALEEWGGGDRGNGRRRA